MLVAIGEKGDGGHEDRDVARKEAPEPRVHHVEMRDDESDESRAPQKEVAEDVHHRIEGDGRHGTRRADVA